MGKMCTISGCHKPHEARGLCVMHYRRLKRHGDPLRELTDDERRQQQRDRMLAKTTRAPHTYPKLFGRHEHRVVMEKKLGRKLLPSEIVHHKDGNKQNRDQDNLELMDRSAHCTEHLPELIYARKVRQAERLAAREREREAEDCPF